MPVVPFLNFRGPQSGAEAESAGNRLVTMALNLRRVDSFRKATLFQWLI